MPITLHGTLSALTISLACLVAFASTEAVACSFAIQRSVKFAPHVSSISNRDRVDLARTVIDANNSVASSGIVVIYAYTEEGEPEGTALTERRVESVKAYLVDLGIAGRFQG